MRIRVSGDIPPFFPKPSWRSHGQMYSLLYLTERSWEQLILAPIILMNVGSIVGPEANCPYCGFYALSQSLETKQWHFFRRATVTFFHIFPNVQGTYNRPNTRSCESSSQCISTYQCKCLRHVIHWNSLLNWLWMRNVSYSRDAWQEQEWLTKVTLVCMQELSALALLHVRMSSMVLYQQATLVKEFFFYINVQSREILLVQYRNRSSRSVYSEVDTHDPSFTILYNKGAAMFTECWN
jgi:hypothetical protein